jgi:hypothetical protein
MKKVVWTSLFLLLSAPVYAQNVTVGPVTTAMKFAWAAPINVPSTELPTFEVRLRDSKSPTVVTALTNVQCSGTPVACTSQLTQSNVDALNMIGAHNITLAYFRQDVGEGAQSTPYLLTSPSLAPTAVRIIP